MKIDFSFETQYGNFCDAIHLPDDHNLTDAEIEAIKQQRLDNWVAVVTSPMLDIAPETETETEPEPEPKVEE
jgi:hypothetical protein